MRFVFVAILIFSSTIVYCQKWDDINALGVQAHEKGEYNKALKYYEEGLILAKKQYGAKSDNYSVALNNYGLLWADLGEFAKAETLYLEALAIRKKVFGEHHKKYAFTLNCLATCYQGMGKYTLAEEYCLKSVEIDSITDGTGTEDYASDLCNLGLLYQHMGKYDKAEACLTHSLKIRKKLVGENDISYIVGLSNLALLYLELGRYAEAEKMFLEVWEKDKKLLGENHPDCGADLNNLASLYSEIDENEKAEIFFLEALRVWQRTYGEISQQNASCLNNLADLYENMGYLEKAEELYLKCKEIGLKVYGENHPEYASCLNNLACLYLDLGKEEEAEDLFLKSALIRQEALGTNHPDFAASLNSLGIIYYRRSQYDDAEAYYIKALGIFIDNYGQSHPFVGRILLNLALLYTTTSQFDKAEELYLVSSNIIKESSGENTYSYAASLWGIAKMYRVMGKYKQSHDFFLRADTAFRNVVGDHSLNYAIVVHGLGILQWEMEDTMETASTFKKSNTIFLSYLDKIFRFTTEDEKTKGLLEVAAYFEKAQSFYYATAATNNQSSTDAFNLHLATNGLVLSSITQLREKIFSEGDDSLKILYSSWEEYNRLITNELSKPISERSDKLDDWENASQMLEKNLNKRSQTFRSAFMSITPDFEQVKKTLREDEAAVEFISFEYENEAESVDTVVYAAMVVTAGCSQPFYLPLFYESQLEGLLYGDTLRTFANLLYSGAMVRGADHDISYGDSLYQLIWKPISDVVKNKSKIYYSPAGLLHKINFDAIPVSETKVLSDIFEMNRTSSTARLIHQESDHFQMNSIALYGGIQYEMSETELKKLADDGHKTKSNTQDLKFLDNQKSVGKFSYLPGSLNEINKIKDILQGKGGKISTYSGVDANEESVKLLSGNASPSVIHFSTHGFFVSEKQKKKNASTELLIGAGSVFSSADDPLFRSGLIMAGADYAWQGNKPIEGVEDGILTSYEVSKMYLPNTKLVVMSACETGLGDIKGSEGVYGLQRAFKMAGVDYMIISLWQVLDKETSDFMILFYQNLISMQSIPKAFKATQNTMKNKYRSEPYKWAGFVLMN